MCFNNTYIELQASKIAEEIRTQSLYKYVGLEYLHGEAEGTLHLEQPKHENGSLLKNVGLISKVLLKDENDTLYRIEPNVNGLKFAKGDISYSKYQKLQRKNDTTIIISFLGIVAFFFISMFLLSKLI